MDKIHEIDKKPWISQRLINIGEVLREREEQLKQNNVTLKVEETNHDQDLERKLDRFSKISEKDIKPCFLFNSADERALLEDPSCSLRMYQRQLDHAKRMISDKDYKMAYLPCLKRTRREILMRHLARVNRSELALESNSKSPPESSSSLRAILVVQLWPQPNRISKTKLEKEVLFLSDQCLTELRDHFKCQRDFGVPMDLSENPEQTEKVFRRELFKSGFFLIGDTFYNDMRDKNNLDLSVGIQEWASKEVVVLGKDGENMKVSKGIGPFKRARMEDTKFEDLKFRLGCPYLYLHQGDCEHLFTISDIRYVSVESDLEHMSFPFITATSIGQKYDNLRCYMCKNRPPHWYTLNNQRLPVDPFFFCESCFFTFNYDAHKKKIGQFQAFPYTSSLGIPDVNVSSSQ